MISYLDPPPRFPNIGYVGSTYDIFKGNPRSTKGLDPGFTLRNLYRFSYLDGSTTVDGTYSIPDHTQARTSQTCSFDFVTETNMQMDSYYDSLKFDVNADFSGWGASFSASFDYKEVHDSSTSHDSTYVSTHALCESYIVSVELEASDINPAFVEAVENLPTQPNHLNDYVDFLEHWGTHVAIEVRMGGRYGVQSSITNQGYTDMASSGLDIEAAAGYSGIMSLNVNAVASHEKSSAEAFESYCKDYQIYQIGGNPPLNETTSTFEWSQTVKDNPLPLKYNLVPLTSYLTSRYFPDDEDISTKQSNLEEAATLYCQNLELPDITYCISSGPSSTPKIQVTFVDTYTKLPCVGPPDRIFAVPVINNPAYRILGTLTENVDLGTKETIVVTGNSVPNELIREAINWNFTYSETDLSFFRPVCDDGFLSIADFACCGDTMDCLDRLPLSLPCIAEQCLTQCGIVVRLGLLNTAAIGFGCNLFGNDLLLTGGSNYYFIRIIRHFTPEHHMCLNFNCLTYM